MPILGKSGDCKPYIVATAAYFHDAYTGKGKEGGRGRGGIKRDIPAEKLYFTLEKLRFMYPMREVTVFGFADVPLADPRSNFT